MSENFTEEELRLLVMSVQSELYSGGTPHKMKAYCNLHTKLLKLIKKECDE